MNLMRTATETTALSLLRRHGIAALWQLEEAAAEAHQAGRDIAAALILEIADAAEVELSRFAISRNGEACDHFSSVRGGSLSTRRREPPIAPCPAILPGYQASPMAATRQQLAIVLLSWLVIFAFIAALVAEALG